MIALKLAQYNTKRLMRRRGLRIALVAVPLAAALLRAAFTGVDAFLYAAELTPVVCALMVGVVLYAQYSVDVATGLVNSLRSSPVSRQSIMISRVLSGASILAVQMVLFGGILAIRF